MLGFRFGCGWCCVVGFLFGCCWFCVLLLCVSAWWNRGIADEVTMASYGRAVTGTAVMARSANEEKKKKKTDLVPSLCLAAFAALIGISLTNEHNALLQHPLIPPQFPSRVIAPLLAGDVDTVTNYVTEILACTGPSWAVKNRRPRSSGSQSPPDDASIQELLHGKFFDNVGQSDHTQDSQYQGKHSRVPLWLLSLPGLTISMLGSPNWQFSSTMHRTSLALHLVGSKPQH